MAGYATGGDVVPASKASSKSGVKSAKKIRTRTWTMSGFGTLGVNMARGKAKGGPGKKDRRKKKNR